MHSTALIVKWYLLFGSICHRYSRSWFRKLKNVWGRNVKCWWNIMTALLPRKLVCFLISLMWLVVHIKRQPCYSLLLTENKFALAKASQLPEIVESEKRKLSEQKKKLEREKYNREKQFWACFKVSLTCKIYIAECTPSKPVNEWVSLYCRPW